MGWGGGGRRGRGEGEGRVLDQVYLHETSPLVLMQSKFQPYVRSFRPLCPIAETGHYVPIILTCITEINVGLPTLLSGHTY